MNSITFAYAYYNSSRGLKAQLELWKSYPEKYRNNIFFIVVDDGSTDKAEPIIEPYKNILNISLYEVYDNYTVGEVAYIVKTVIEEKEESPNSILLNIKDIPDARNYRVSINKAKEILGFHPTSAVSDIVLDLLKHWDGFGNLDNDNYYNIKICEKLFGPQNI